MPLLNFHYEIKKIAIIKTDDKKAVSIGEVTHYKENSDNTAINVSIRLKKDLPQNLIDMLIKRPDMIEIVGERSNPKGLMLLPIGEIN